MRSFAIALMLAGAAVVASPAAADEANPDADRLLRVICYAVATRPDPSTRDFSFTVVMQQVSTDPFDASHFIEGNRNYREGLVGPSPMTINVYRDGQNYSEDADIETQAEELLNTSPSLSFTGKVERWDRRYMFGLDQGGETGLVNYDPDNQDLTT